MKPCAKYDSSNRLNRWPILLVYVLLVLSTHLVCAQSNHEVDSIRRVIAQAKNDTTRIGAMIALGKQIYTADPDTNMIICKQAIDLADRALGKSGISKQLRSTLLRQKATAVNYLAVSHYIFGQLDSALLLFQQAERIHKRSGHRDGVAGIINNQGLVYGLMGNHVDQRRCLYEALKEYRRVEGGNVGTALNNIGVYYEDLGLPDSALIYLDSSLQVFRTAENKRGMASSMLNIGMNYAIRGRPAEALEHFLECERLNNELQEDVNLATCLNNIGSIFMRQGMMSEALSYFHRSLDIDIARNNRIDEALGRMNIGGVLDEQGESDMALVEYEKALVVFSNSGARTDEALVHGHIGTVWKGKGNNDKALKHLRLALRISVDVGIPGDISVAMSKLGQFHESINELDTALAYYNDCLTIYERIGDRELEVYMLYSVANVKLKQGLTAEAEEAGRRSINLALELGFPKSIMLAAQVLNETLAKQGKWGPALEMLELHQQMNDSVNNAENVKKTVGLQLRYGFDKKQLADSLAHASVMGELDNEKRIATLESEQARNRSWAFGVGGLLLLGGGGVVYRVDRKRRRERFERDAARLQTRILQTQMNPHFIFNALNSINGYVLDNDNDIATGFLTKFSRLMRLVLENSQHAEISLKQDLECLCLYMDLEQSRMQGKFDYTMEVDPAIDQASTLVPPLVIQPFVENAIWHGISRKEGNGHIRLAISKSDGNLSMVVSDDGVGRPSLAKQELPMDIPHRSMGTQITRDRLELLGRLNGSVAGFRYRDVAVGTTVEVTVPLMVG